jgi:6-pyruvoyl-tetrahydropterin synthase
MKFFIEVVGDEWIDFYDVKEWIENILSDFDHTNITKEYDISTVEQFSYVVRSRVSEIFQEKTGLPNRDVQIEIYETDKFGVRTLDDGT